MMEPDQKAVIEGQKKTQLLAAIAEAVSENPALMAIQNRINAPTPASSSLFSRSKPPKMDDYIQEVIALLQQQIANERALAQAAIEAAKGRMVTNAASHGKGEALTASSPR